MNWATLLLSGVSAGRTMTGKSRFIDAECTVHWKAPLSIAEQPAGSAAAAGMTVGTTVRDAATAVAAASPAARVRRGSGRRCRPT